MATQEEIKRKEETLEGIKAAIEKMSKEHHLDVLQLLKRYPQVTLNENRHGIYVNLSFVSDEVIRDLEQYIQYKLTYEAQLKEAELQKMTMVE